MLVQMTSDVPWPSPECVMVLAQNWMMHAPATKPTTVCGTKLPLMSACGCSSSVRQMACRGIPGGRQGKQRGDMAMRG